ncbi:MAG: (4Fe-4S)-binding protein [Gemmatimonadaceae bacterium]|jgi:uncharacterized Fe-S cluster protein YjdI
MGKRLQTYEAPGITVTFDPEICVHSGACVRGLPAVFDERRKRWIHAEAASPDEVAAQVERCPSGALQYRRDRPPTETDDGRA